MKRKTYNPLKMIGSYIGVIIGFLLSLKLTLEIFSKGFLYQDELCGFLCGFVNNNSTLLGYLIWIIVGFLVGWGIHSLVRYFRK